MSSTPLALSFSLFNEIAKINQLTQALMNSKLPDGFLTSHFGVLNHLINVHDGRTPLELARAFQVPKTTLSHTLAGLKENNLIDFRSNPKDGRSKCVWVTDAGRGFVGQAIMSVAPELTKFCGHLPPDNLPTLVDDLVNIRKWLDTEQCA